MCLPFVGTRCVDNCNCLFNEQFDSLGQGAIHLSGQSSQPTSSSLRQQTSEMPADATSTVCLLRSWFSAVSVYVAAI